MIDIEKVKDDGFLVRRDVDLESILALSKRADVVSATEGRVTIVQDGLMRNSLDASWHQDGLSYERPPSVVLLYCERKGRGDITTDLSDASLALDRMDEDSREVLDTLSRYYVSRSGKRTHEAKIVKSDAPDMTPYLSLCSRGWVQGDLNMTLEKMTRAMHQLFENLKPHYEHTWMDRDCLIFDNRRFVHRRFNPENKTDPDRRLIRIWFN